MNSPIPYFGGKSRLAASIIDRFPKHKTYAEVFGGAAWVLFKKAPSQVEVLNDLDRHLMNFYRVTKYHPDALADEVAGLQPGRDVFRHLREELERPAMTDIQKAAAYYYVQRQAFAGRPNRPSLATSAGRPVRCRAAVARRVLPQVAERLKEVMLENLAWERFLKLYDTPDTFFFVDPPYIGHNEYRHNLTPAGFEALAAALKNLKGRFLMTHTDRPEIRRLFAGLTVEAVEVAYSAHQLTKGHARQVGREVLISNY
jgi:DNA adenine methylase